jgi:hypothetical protein
MPKYTPQAARANPTRPGKTAAPSVHTVSRGSSNEGGPAGTHRVAARSAALWAAVKTGSGAQRAARRASGGAASASAEADAHPAASASRSRA